jgi:hypothetical protein
MRWFKAQRNWGLLVLGIWLIAMAVLQLIPQISFNGSGLLLALVALAAGILLVLGR